MISFIRRFPFRFLPNALPCVWLTVALLAVSGCQAIQESTNLVPLPENSPPMPYRDLVVRARFQARAADESFYANKWAELEETAKVLQQTSSLVGKATGVPVAREKAIHDTSLLLGQQATVLRGLATAKDEKGTNECMQRINSLVRELRVEP
ncbi:MAG: hypothetical protein NTV55_06740 [Planctomycetota bacterium]|nr:hypothetical protein [Planctomycetota bacterium]